MSNKTLTTYLVMNFLDTSVQKKTIWQLNNFKAIIFYLNYTTTQVPTYVMFLYLPKYLPTYKMDGFQGN